MSRVWRVVQDKQAMDTTLANVIDNERKFTFFPYIHTPLGIIPLTLDENRSRDILLSRRDSLEPFAIAIDSMVASAMLPFKLEYSKSKAAGL